MHRVASVLFVELHGVHAFLPHHQARATLVVEFVLKDGRRDHGGVCFVGPESDEVPHGFNEPAPCVPRDVVRDVRVVRLHQRDVVRLAQTHGGPDERARGRAVDEVGRVFLEHLRHPRILGVGEEEGWDGVEREVEAVDADDLRARVRLRGVPVGGHHDDVVAEFDEVLDEPEEAVLHAGDVRERGGLDEDADALPLAGGGGGGLR